MTRKYFGTDGIRGRVGDDPITPDFVMRLGYAAGRVLIGLDTLRAANAHPAVVIGKDTRISGYMLESALQAGLSAAGVDVLLTGPMPTPAIAYLTRALRAQAGIVISASHNSFEDNGIKFFSASGTKLGDDIERAIEAELERPMEVKPSIALGKARRVKDAEGRYIEFCKSTFPSGMDLRGLKIVIDCAHGASYHVAPSILHELGADVISIGVQPDGLNINHACGSTHPKTLQAAVLQHQADVGIALDGDGDRVVMVDDQGNILDGDQLLYVITAYRHKTGALVGGVVGTLMTNLAFEHALARLDIPFLRANVGDRYVLEMMKEQGWLLGGENSGHILCLDQHTSGDGIIAALQVLQVMRDTEQPLFELGNALKLYPQVLLNVLVDKPLDLEASANIQAAVASVQASLNGGGRVLLRASGTEPKVRVMVEGQSSDEVKQYAQDIAQVVEAEAHLG